MRVNMNRAIFLALLLSGLPLTAFAGPLIVGVFEQPQCKRERPISARLLFVKDKTTWWALDDESSPLKDINLILLPKWQVVFGGKDLGNIKLRDPNPSLTNKKDMNYTRDKLYVPDSQKALPIIENDSESFRGWCDVPKTRPLVLVSQPNFTDPEQWKPFSMDNSYKQKLYTPVKVAIGRFKVYYCPRGELPPEPLEYGPADLVLYKSFRSASGRELVSIGIDPKKYQCDGPREPEWSGNWFLLDGEKIEFLGHQMELVDAGDYDHDGRSELLFWHSGYNRDGYVLMYDGLRQKVEYLWGYH